MAGSAVAAVGAEVAQNPGPAQAPDGSLPPVSESKAYGRRLSSRRHGQGTDRIDLAVAAAMAMKAYDDNLADHQGGATGFVVDL